MSLFDVTISILVGTYNTTFITNSEVGFTETHLWSFFLKTDAEKNLHTVKQESSTSGEQACHVQIMDLSETKASDYGQISGSNDTSSSSLHWFSMDSSKPSQK